VQLFKLPYRRFSTGVALGAFERIIGFWGVRRLKIGDTAGSSFLEHAIGFSANVTDPQERVPTQ
jgi:hypothetical protein